MSEGLIFFEGAFIMIFLMRVREIREKNREEIEQALRDARGALRDVRFRIAQREEKRHTEHYKLRRCIARMLTVLNERS